jgi:membrane protein YdbS with pleckstrin-like domain
VPTNTDIRGFFMPLLLFLLLVLLIAQIGFWDTLDALLGAAAMVILFILLAVAAVGVASYVVLSRVRRRL